MEGGCNLFLLRPVIQEVMGYGGNGGRGEGGKERGTEREKTGGGGGG